MRLLVTGGAGFIGANFILFWLENHPEDLVINYDLLTYAGNLENLKKIENNPRYTFILGDICDRNLLNKAIENVDIIVHFAAESHVDRSIMDPAVFVKTNILGTQVLLDIARDNRIKRFHHISTDEVFGSLELNSSEKFKEDTKYNPSSPYAASKAGSDHLVRSYALTYGLPITISNCSNNFGPYQFPEKFIPLAITNILEGKKIPLYGDGLYIRDWLYVEDHCRAIELILKNGIIGETYCIGGMTNSLSNIEIAKKIIKYLDKDESYIEFIKDRPGHDRRYEIDWSKIKKELNWQPMHDFDTWLAKTIDWYKENQQWWRDVKSGEYQKYYEKQYGK